MCDIVPGETDDFKSTPLTASSFRGATKSRARNDDGERNALRRFEIRQAQAARTLDRNEFTSPASCSACWERLEAAVSTLPAALPVSLVAVLTAPIFLVTSCVASAVWVTLREISAVAEPCCSIAAPIA